jgi:hypothetical protein
MRMAEKKEILSKHRENKEWNMNAGRSNACLLVFGIGIYDNSISP